MARGANYFAEVPLEGLRWASIFAHTGTAAWYQRDVVPYMRERVLARASRIVRDERGALHAGKGGGFCTT